MVVIFSGVEAVSEREREGALGMLAILFLEDQSVLNFWKFFQLYSYAYLSVCILHFHKKLKLKKLQQLVSPIKRLVSSYCFKLFSSEWKRHITTYQVAFHIK